MTRFVVALGLVVALVGCNGGSDGGSEDIPERRPSGDVSGVAFDGLIINGNIRVYSWDGDRGELLAEGSTNNDGEYSITLDQVRSQPVMVEVTGGRYTEEASGRNVSLREGDALYALYPYEQGEELDIHLTYYTTLAAGLADHMVRTGTSADSAIRQANDAISNLIGLDVRTTTPVDVTDADNASPSITDSLRYGFATASISQLTKWISEKNDRSLHDPYSSIRFAKAAYRDIKHDGKLDGKGPDGDVALGIVPLDQTIYRHDIARNMLVMANDKNNATNIEPDAVSKTAQNLSESNSSMFGSVKPVGLDSEGPDFTNISHTPDEVVAGTIEISADVVDPVGIRKTELYVNGKLHDVQESGDSLSVAYDTSLVEDGLNTFTMKAVNTAGGTSEKDVRLKVANDALTISDISPQNNSFINGNVTFSAKVTDSQEIVDTRFVFQGATYFPDSKETPTYDLDTTSLEDKDYVITLVAKNEAGDEVSKDISFTVDNTPPSISWSLNNNDYLSGEYTLNPSFSDSSGIDNVNFYIEGNKEREFNSIEEFTHILKTSEYNDGFYKLALEVTDKADNVTTDNASVEFNNTPPQLSIAGPGSGSTITGTFDLDLDVFDSVSIDSVVIRVDGDHARTVDSVDNGNLSVSIDPNTFGSGERSLKATAFNRPGMSATKTINLDFQHIPPSLNQTVKDVVDDGDNGIYTTELEYVIENYNPNKSYQIVGFESRNEADGSEWTSVNHGFSSDGDTLSYTTPGGRGCDWPFRKDLRFKVKDSNGLLSDRVFVSDVFHCP